MRLCRRDDLKRKEALVLLREAKQGIIEAMQLCNELPPAARKEIEELFTQTGNLWYRADNPEGPRS